MDQTFLEVLVARKRNMAAAVLKIVCGILSVFSLILVPYTVFFLAGALLFVLYVPNQAKSTIEKRVELTLDENRFQPQGERTLILLDDMLLIRDAKGEEQVRLDEIDSTVRNKKHIFILTKAREVVVVPLAAFETLDDAQNFYSGLPNARTLEK